MPSVRSVSQMASIEKKSSSNSAPGQGQPPPNNYNAQFYPPYPSMRSGASEQRSHSSDQSSQGSRSRTSYRGSSIPSKPDMKYSNYPKGATSKDKMMSPRMPNNYSRQRKNSHGEYYRQGDGKNYEVYHPAERREGPARSEDRRSEHRNQFNSYSRDGPSPGRGYTQTFPPEQMRQNLPQSQGAQGTAGPLPPFRTPQMSGSKRKAQDLSSPGGPRLISNQSSDDSINALLPPKRARSNNGFSDSNVLMKSFTPLSPIHSRTFSRDDPIDMSRFMDSRGSAEGMRIFQSWSSGNSPQDDHSPIDVRLCYNDWHGQPQAMRKSNRSFSDRLPPVKLEEIQGSSSRTSSNRTPQTKTSRGRSTPPERYSRQQFNGRPQNTQDEQYQSQKSYRGGSSSQFCQPLHPEDRFGPFNDQLSRRMPGYSYEAESGRYWQGDVLPYQQQYPSNMRGPPDDMMMKSQGRRGTPPGTNSWNRQDEYASSMYDHGQMVQHPSQYESWSDNRPYADPYGNNGPPPIEPREYSGRHLQSASIESGPDGLATGITTANGVLLLALPDDKISLSETLCIVRENIEVFVATEADVKAPAPGRKRPVVIGQVGLRCIHCRAAAHQSDKVKRAVCFPSSIKRIYRTVIDMKLDHFKACRFVPVEFKRKLEQLKATNARSTGTTMQYFVQASKRMGMVDGGHGIRLCKETTESSNNVQIPEQVANNSAKAQKPIANDEKKTSELVRRRSLPNMQPGVSFSLSMDLSLGGTSAGSGSKFNSNSSQSSNIEIKDDTPTYEGKISLATPEDKAALSPLRCFLRENVCAFTATAEDIAVRTPTTFSVVEGQVGIACIHCQHLPSKLRSNRAVCFPFSIGRVYQSVADIQRFHFGECKMIPDSVKRQFFDLQKASTKGSKGLATRQYWISSARKLGLADSRSGIRFIRDPNVPLEKAVSLDILAQVATDVTTAAKPLVLPEDKPQIAGFIYLVMKQLQPCRFTEADRNKRRLKDVGCIGVECKHCAGQVDGRKFFWSSVNAVESNFVSVHTHMMECKQISQEMKDELANLKTLRKEHTSKLKTGSQKLFFSRVWNRLHADGEKIPTSSGIRKTPSPTTVPPQVAVHLSSQSRGSPSSSSPQYSSQNLSKFSSPNSSFSEGMSSPISSEQGQHSQPPLGGSPDESVEKFPLLSLNMSSPTSSPPRPDGAEDNTDSKINVEFV